MATSSSQESGAACVAYTSRAASRGSERVTPLLRDALRCASTPLRETRPRPEHTCSSTLPVLATAGDVRELVRLLKKRTTGMTLIAAMGSEQKRIFDPRKIAAYEFWGIINRDGERIRLTPLGYEIARRLEPEARVYRTVLDNIIFYRSALEWVFRQGLDLVTHPDVAAYWQEHYPEAIDEHDEKTVEGSVICFFHLCQAAELGTTTIGKRGQPARLYVERKELSDFLQSGAPPPSTVEMFTCNRQEEADPSAQSGASSAPIPQHVAGPTARTRGRLLLVSHGQRSEVVEQIRVTLELAGIESETVERTTTSSPGPMTERLGPAGPVAEHILQAMRRCDRAVIVVAREDCHTDDATDERASLNRLSPNDDVLIEIGAAFVFYDRRVVLLWDEEVPVPGNLQNLSCCRFAAGGLTWETGVSMMKAITELKD